jgi:Holliday junction resolvasome RuvABC endonuclease subunit
MPRKSRPKERTVIVNLPQDNCVLGLDCSSATIGWGLVSPDLKLISYGHIKPLPSKKGELIERLSDTYNRVLELCQNTNPTYIAVEDIKKFMGRKSTAQTITILAGFNRVISVAAFNYANDLIYYSESTVRKIIRQRYTEKSKLNKDIMSDIIREYLEPTFKGPLNTKGAIAKEVLDEADGIAIAWAHAITLEKK